MDFVNFGSPYWVFGQSYMMVPQEHWEHLYLRDHPGMSINGPLGCLALVRRPCIDGRVADDEASNINEKTIMDKKQEDTFSLLESIFKCPICYNQAGVWMCPTCQQCFC